MDSDDQQRLMEQAAKAKGPYGDSPAIPEDHSRLRFYLLGEGDPQLPSRVLGLLTIRGNLPMQFGFTRLDGGENIEMHFELFAHEVALSEQLLDRLLRLPTVIEANVLSVV